MLRSSSCGAESSSAPSSVTSASVTTSVMLASDTGGLSDRGVLLSNIYGYCRHASDSTSLSRSYQRGCARNQCRAKKILS